MNRIELIAHVRAEEQTDPLFQPCRCGNFVNQSAVVFQHQVQRRLRQGEPGDGFADVPKFGRDGAQEFLPNRDVVEEVFHFDARSECSIPGSNAGELIAVTGQLGTFTSDPLRAIAG